MLLYLLNTYLIVLLLLELARLLWLLRLRGQHQARSRANPLRYEDCSALELEPPAPLRPIIQELHGMGFTRLGEVQTVGGAYDPPRRAWCLADETHTIVCDTFLQFNPEKPPILSFATSFKQGHVGTLVMQPDTRLRDVYDSDFWAETLWPVTIPAAFQRHQDVVRQYALRLGEPVECQSIEDYLRLSYDYMERYFPRRRTGRKLSPKIQAMLIIGWGEPVVSTLLLLVALLMPGGWLRLLLSLMPLALFVIQFAFVRSILQDFGGKERVSAIRKTT